MSARFEALLRELVAVEGGFVNRPDDSGGPTNRGITLATLSAWRGYPATIDDLRALTAEQAKQIYRELYIVQPHFDQLALLSEQIAAELIDTGVNMGPHEAVQFLQRALNVFNQRDTLFRNLVIDGLCGAKTRAALAAFIQARGRKGELVLVKALNCLQGAAYIALAERREKDERFVFGWIRARVALAVS